MHAKASIRAPRRALIVATLALPALRRAGAQPQTAPGWTPSRPIRVIVPFPPGQANDIYARLIAEKTGDLVWPQHRMVVENRAGAGGTIGMEAAAQAAPDGHTLVFGSLATLAINPAIRRNLPYDPERDFTPILRVFEGALVLVVPADGPDADLPALIARARREVLDYASSGPGSTAQMASELFLQGIGAGASHVPYRGSTAALTDVMAGAVDFAFESTAAAMPLVRQGLLRALAITSATRQDGLAEIPTVEEAAPLPGYAAYGAGGFLAPARTPAAVIAALHEGLATAMEHPAVGARIRETGAVPLAEGPDGFATFIRRELDKWREVAQRGGIRLDP